MRHLYNYSCLAVWLSLLAFLVYLCSTASSSFVSNPFRLILLYGAFFVFVFNISCSFLDPGFTPLNASKLATDVCSKCTSHKVQSAVHCEYCGRCVKGYVQHSLLIGNCVGAQNKVHFWVCLGLLQALMLYIIGLYVYVLIHVTQFWPMLGLAMTCFVEVILAMATFASTWDRELPYSRVKS